MSEAANAGNPEFIFAQSMAAFQRHDFERAIRHSDRLLQVSNRKGPALVWAVRLRIEAKRWQEAIVMGRDGLEANPGLCGLLGHAFEGLDNLVEAQRCYERACREQPENPTWLYHNASALSRLYRDFEAMESLKTALEIAPDPGAFIQLGNYELTFGSPEAALAASERGPESADRHILAATSLLTMGRIEASERHWGLAAEGAPSKQNVALQRAIALVRRGDFDHGIEGLHKCIERNPRPALAYAQIVSAKRVTEVDRPLVAKMEELAQSENLTDEERTALHFGLGKSYDNLREFGPAIQHFNQANWLQGRPIRESGGFDRNGYAENMEFRKRTYDLGAVARLKGIGNPSELPIFVLGMMRSGTTLAEQILSCHAQVSGAGEQDFWINADPRLTDYGHHPLNEGVLRGAGEVYLRLLKRFSKPEDLRVVDKQPGNLILAGALHIAFPNARIIYMRRRPVDTAISIWTTHIRTSTRFVNDKANIVTAFQEHEELIDHWRRVIPADRFLEVSYESLISDRESQTRRMVEFCGLPWDDACLSPEKNQKPVITPSLWQVRQPVYRTSLDRWKNYEPWLDEFRELLPG